LLDLISSLYSYYQSTDLKETHRCTELNLFKEKLFSKEFIDQIALGTQIQLHHERIDLSAFVYEKGSYLMCHDDHIGDADDDMNGKETDARRIAFIFYLVDEDWSEQEGGALQLFQW
jgi:Rps23 Pro-64 3,4-dihydroxylase Tpa1-like proline 4-hydroxylase